MGDKRSKAELLETLGRYETRADVAERILCGMLNVGGVERVDVRFGSPVERGVIRYRLRAAAGSADVITFLYAADGRAYVQDSGDLLALQDFYNKRAELAGGSFNYAMRAELETIRGKANKALANA